MAGELSYVEDYAPGTGRHSPARAWVSSDAPQLSLNGDWRFRLWPSVGEAPDEVADPAYDDRDWDVLPVPSHWVLQRDGAYGRPIYTNIAYPFPIDPPYVPDENPTGDHRRTFPAPDWVDAQDRVLLRFDGVESVYRVWLNGAEIGVGKGSRLVQEFDVTDALRPGDNVVVVRVHQWSSMSYLEDQDQWWLPGIFRDVTLLARPRRGIEDVWLDAGYDPITGRGRIVAQVTTEPDAGPVLLEVPELGLRAELAGPTTEVEAGSVEPWSAEVPRLYAAAVSSAGERVSLRV
ncbi:MAG: sugar-binding domain-containing protein, partial [Actinomycetes bacterium]